MVPEHTGVGLPTPFPVSAHAGRISFRDRADQAGDENRLGNPAVASS